MDEVDPVGQHAAQSLRQRGVEPKVQRAARDAEMRAGVAQLALTAGAFDEDAPLLRLLRRRSGRLVGQRQRVEVVGRRVGCIGGAGRQHGGERQAQRDGSLAHAHSGLKRGR